LDSLWAVDGSLNSWHLGARQVPIVIRELKESMFPDDDFRPKL